MPSLPSLRYVNGYYKPQIVTTNTTDLASQLNTQDIYVVKYTTAGTPVWSARITTTGSDTGFSIRTDTQGNVYASGTVLARATLYNADGTVFDTLVPNDGGSDAVIVKYNAYGVVQWFVRVASVNNDQGYAVAVDSSGNVYATGFVANTATAYSANGTAFGTTIPSGTGTGNFLVKYNASGIVQWVSRGVVATGSGAVTGWGLTVDSTGLINMTGQSTNASVVMRAFNADGTSFGTTFTSGGCAWIVQYNGSGVVQWFTRVGGTGTVLGYGVAVDLSNNVYVTGQSQTNGVAVIAYNANGTSFGTTYTTSGAGDAFVVKYSSTGTVQWLARVSSTAIDIGFGIVVDSGGCPFIVGQGGSGVVVTAYNANGTAFSPTLANSGANDIFVVKYDTNGSVLWVTRIASIVADIGYGVAVDAGDSIYVTGQAGASAGGTLTVFNSNGSTFGTLPNNFGTTNSFIVKYDTSGNAQWVRGLTSPAADIGRGIAVDSSGNIYATGLFAGFPNTLYGPTSLFSSTSIGASDALIVKYNTNGAPQWVARIGSSGTGSGYGTATDGSGNVYVTGSGGGTITAFNANGSAFGTTLPNAGGTDVFVAKYNGSGTVQWLARIASSGNDIGYSIATDFDGNVFVTGQGGSGAVVTAYSANGSAFGTTLANAGGTDTFLVKYNTSGTVQWVARIASTGDDIGYKVQTDWNGNAIVTGQGGAGVTVTAYSSNGVAFGTTLASAGSNDMFIIEYNGSGTVQWVARIASVDSDSGRGVAVDWLGNIYVTGSGGATSTITAFSSNGNAFATTIPSSGSTSAFLVKYDTSGIVQWVARLANTTGYGVAVDFLGNAYVTTSSTGLSAYNADGTLYQTYAAGASIDTWIIKYKTSNGAVSWVSRIGSSLSDIGYAISADANGNSYVGGIFGGTASTNAISVTTSDGSASFTGRSTFAVVKFDTAGFFKWAQAIGNLNAIYDVSTSFAGDTFITGQATAGTLKVFNADMTPYFTFNNRSTQDAYVVKYSSSGTPQWVTTISSLIATSTAGNGITTDPSGNVIAIGSSGSGSTVTFYNANGTVFGTTLANAGLTDAFLVKYNTSGTVQWVARLASTAGDTGNAVSTDSSSNIYVTGGYGNTLTVFNSDGSAFGTTLALTGSTNGFVVKYNSAGTVQWVTRISTGVGPAFGGGILSAPGGNVYFCGSSGNSGQTTTLYNSNGTTATPTLGNTGITIALFVKYDTNGTVQTRGSLNGNSCAAGGVVTNSAETAIYFSGRCSVNTTTNVLQVLNANNTVGTSFTGNLGVSDGFVAKYTSAGVVTWATRMGGASVNVGTGAGIAGGIAIDSSENLYVVNAYSGGTITFYSAGGAAFGTTLANAGGNDGFLAKYNSNGIVQWVARIAFTGSDITYSVKVDSAGSVYVSGLATTFVEAYNSDGTFFGTSSMSPNLAGTFTFIVKYDTNGNVQWISSMTGPNSLNRWMELDSSTNIYAIGNITASSFVPASS